MRHLRDYQREAITDLLSRWDAGSTRVPMVLATGLGKTEIFTALESEWVASLAAKYGLGKRVLVIAHTDELIEQAARKARQRNPHLTVGIVKAGLNQAHAQIVVSSRQTLASEKRRAQINNVGLIIVDEAHHALRSNTYGRILEHFGAFCAHDVGPDNPCMQLHPKVAGFTATLARGDKGKLSTVWEECTFRRDILFGIRRGYLLDVRGERVVVPDLDMSRVRQTAGDYRDGDIAQELERTFAPQIIAEKYAQTARDDVGGLRQGIAFWPLVETAYHGAAAFESAGIASAVVHGALPKEERRLILKRFHAGDVKVIHNCMVLTEGFDAPHADVVVVARPTRSAPLYQQMVGRVLRPDLTVPAEQRGKALILDVTGAGAQHDLRSLIDLSPERPLRADEDEQLSLLELDEELLALEEERAAHGGSFTLQEEVYAGQTETVAFDPLHRDRLWSRTPGGTFFMSAGGGAYVFLHESASGDPGTWDVIACSKDVRGPARLTEWTGLAMDEALMYAEEGAEKIGGVGTKTLTGRSSAWRRAAPTEAQLRLARGRGVVVPVRDDAPAEVRGRGYALEPEFSAWSKGQVSEVIDAAQAARRIDPLVRAVRTMMSEENANG